jgi:hypothetical protein
MELFPGESSSQYIIVLGTSADTPAAARKQTFMKIFIRRYILPAANKKIAPKKGNAPHELWQGNEQLHHTCNKSIRNTFQSSATEVS